MSQENVLVTEETSGNIFKRKCFLPEAGDRIPEHVHKYDHTMFFMRGRGSVRTTFANGNVVEQTAEAGDDVFVPKGALHGVEALSDDVYFVCVFPHRDKNGEITDEPASREAYD